MISDAPWGDSAYSVAAALGLMGKLSVSPPSVSVVIAFLGADESLLGSRAYAAYCADQTALAVLRVEIGGETAGSRAELVFGGQGQLSPYWFLDRGIRAVRAAGFRDIVRANRSILHRTGLTESQTALDPWFQKGLPALTVRIPGQEGKATEAQNADGSESSVRLLESFVRSFSDGIPDQWDRQYVLFEVAGIRITVRETQYLAIVLGIYAVLGFLFALDSLRRRDILQEDLHQIPQGLLALGAVFLALFLCVFVCMLIFKGSLRGIKAPLYWQIHPVGFFVFRMAQLLVLFTSAASMLAHLGIIPRKAEFFRESPVVVLGVDVLLFSALRVSLSFLFLWAFISNFIGHRLARTIKKTWPEVVALPLSLLPLAFVLVELIRSPEFVAFQTFLTPGIRGVAYQCFMALPFLLMFVALGEGLLRKRFYRARTSVICGIVFLVVTLAGTGWFLADARGYTGVEDVRVRESIDETAMLRSFEVAGLRPLPSAMLTRPGLSLAVEKGASIWKGQAPASEKMLDLSASRKFFLDRALITLSISAREKPYRIRVEIPQIVSGSIYDCSYPFKTNEDGKGILISVGVRPSDPLTVSLTVSQDFQGPAYVIAEYQDAPEPFETDGRLHITGQYAEYKSGIFLPARP